MSDWSPVIVAAGASIVAAGLGALRYMGRIRTPEDGVMDKTLRDEMKAALKDAQDRYEAMVAALKTSDERYNALEKRYDGLLLEFATLHESNLKERTECEHRIAVLEARWQDFLDSLDEQGANGNVSASGRFRRFSGPVPRRKE